VRLKTYFAGTVEAAMSLAGKELGPEAMLLGSRQAPAEAGRPGEYEVTFGVAPENVARELTATPAPPAWENIRRELLDLRKQMERTAEAVTRSQAISAGLASHPETAEYLAILLDAGLPVELARDLLERVRPHLGRTGNAWERRAGFAAVNDRDRFCKLVAGELESAIGVDPTLGKPAASNCVVALVGPAGCGKTTTLVKLAASYGMKARRPVQILSMDTYRIAAAEQLRCYASILGVGFQVIDTPRAMSQALEEHKGKEMILIDTPGIGAGDSEVGEDLSMVFSSHPEIDVHLVLPATMKSEDLQSATRRFAPLGATKLIFTRVDEAASLGSVAGEAIRAELPVSFLCDGQQIPEDLHEAEARRLVETLFSGTQLGAVAAA
jgi:flagellar biosynthesis protein FlhF